MENIIKIDREISKLKEKIINSLDGKSFKDICQFEVRNGNKIVPWDLIRHSGIYLFQMKIDNPEDNYRDWLSSFEKIWEGEEYTDKFTPNIKKKRTSKHEKLSPWFPIYLGKSKNIKDRIYGHLNLPLESRTYALKLNARKNIANTTFKLSTINIKVNNYNQIMPIVEKHYRDLINPIIGKQ